MGAVVLISRSELRRRRGSVLLLVLMVALVSGAVLTSAAGARRTSTVLDRFIEATGEPDAVVGLARPRVASDTAAVLGLADELGALEGVQRVAVVQGIPVLGQTEEDLTVLTAPSEQHAVPGTPHLLDGRLPRADSLVEVAIHEGLAAELSLVVGDALALPTTTVASGEALYNGQVEGFLTDGPVLEVEVVGVFRDTGSFDVELPPAVLASPALGERVGEAAAFSVFFQRLGDPEVIDLDQAQALLQGAVPDGDVWGGTLAENIDPVNTAFDSVATGLLLFAVIAGIAGGIALGIAISRHVGLSEAVAIEIRTLGMSRSRAAVATAIPAILATAAGVALGALAAVLLSPRFPISIARQAEIDKGISIDWLLLASVGGLIAVAACAWALLAARRQLRPPPVASGGAQRPRWAALRRALPPPAAIGVGSVLGRPARRSGARVGSAVLGSIVGVAGVLGIALFTASQHEAVEDTARFGWTWDASPDLFTEDPLPIVDALVADPRVDSVGGLFSLPMLVESEFLWTGALLVAGGSMELTYLDGRAPQSPDEAALGRRTMADLDVDLGDSVEVVGTNGEATQVTVVGQAVVPNDSDQPGKGMILSTDGFMALAGDEFQQQLLLRYPSGVDAVDAASALETDYPLEFTFYAYPNPPDTLSQLGRMRATLVALAIFVGVLGVVGLMQFLLLSTRTRRDDLAVLKALGFIRSQVRAVVSWQAVTVAAIGVLVGAPLGLIIGRWAWVAAVDQIGIVETPTIPWVVGLVVAVVAVVGAAALAVVPGWLAARRSPAEALHTE